MSENITVRVQTVEIDRGKDTLVTQVPEHEVEVLRVVHGHANVRVSDEDADEAELNGSAEAELQRLQNCYRRVNAPDPVRMAFPGGPRELERFGFGRGTATEVPMAQVVDHKKAARAAAAKKTAAK